MKSFVQQGNPTHYDPGFIPQELLENLFVDQIGRRLLNVEDIQQMIAKCFRPTDVHIREEASILGLKLFQQIQESEFDRVSVESQLLKCLIQQRLVPSVQLKQKFEFLPNVQSEFSKFTEQPRAPGNVDLGLFTPFYSFNRPNSFNTFQDLMLLQIQSQQALICALSDLDASLYPRCSGALLQMELLKSHLRISNGFLVNPASYLPRSDFDFTIVKKQASKCQPFHLLICKYSSDEERERVNPDFVNIQKFLSRVRGDQQMEEQRRVNRLDDFGKFYKNGVMTQEKREQIGYVEYLRSKYAQFPEKFAAVREVESQHAQSQQKFRDLHRQQMQKVSRESQEKLARLGQMRAKTEAKHRKTLLPESQRVVPSLDLCSKQHPKMYPSTEKRKQAPLKEAQFPDPPTVEQITAYADLSMPLELGNVNDHLPIDASVDIYYGKNFIQVHSMDDMANIIGETKIWRNSLHVPLSVAFHEVLCQNSMDYNRSRWVAFQQQEPGELLLLGTQQFVNIAINRAIQEKQKNTQEQQALLNRWGETILKIASSRPIPLNFTPILTSCGRFTQYLNIDTGQIATVHPEVRKAQEIISKEFKKLEACVQIRPNSEILQILARLSRFLDKHIYFAGEALLNQALELKQEQSVLTRDIVNLVGDYLGLREIEVIKGSLSLRRAFNNSRIQQLLSSQNLTEYLDQK